MRYAPDHKQQTRQRILAAAGVVFRRRGFAAAGVDEIMREAELTAGGFYAHFRSKDELFAAAFLEQLQQSQTLTGDALPPPERALAADAESPDEAPPRGARLRATARRYLSRAHRCHIEQGCPLPPLLADLPRQSVAMRRVFQEFLEGSIRRLAETPPSAAAQNTAAMAADERRALAALATMVGGVALSRAVADGALADDILAACRELIDSSLDVANPDSVELSKPSRQPTVRNLSPRRKGKPKQ